MKCEDCSSKIVEKPLYTNEKWTVIESWIPKHDVWIQLAYRTIDSIREYRLLGQIDSAFDVVHSGDTSEGNKRLAYDEWQQLEESVWAKLAKS